MQLARGTPVYDASLLSLAAGDDTVVAMSSEVGATYEEGTYETDVVSERRTRHCVSRPSRTTRIGCGTDVPIQEGLSMRNKNTSRDRDSGQGRTTRTLPRARTNGRGGPGAYAYSMAPSPAPVKSPPIGGASDFEAVARALSHDRLNPYLQYAENDPTQALALYTWNEEVSSAFHRDLGTFEVALRNSIHRCLVDAYGSDWLTNGRARLDQESNSRVDRVLSTLRLRGKPVTPPNIVADLPFGFWVGLLRSGGLIKMHGPKADYETTIWRKAVRKAFRHGERLARRDVLEMVKPLHELRNRVAHCEPIYLLDLDQEYQRILAVTGWMCPVMRSWIDQKSQVPRLLRERPVVA